MIGSFWNLCRACPSMPIDKLHSEYRSTYTWHEYTGPNQEHTVVRRAPQAPSTNDTSAKLQSAKSIEDENNEGTSLEPPLPRRKKYPELAYRTHEFIPAANAIDGGGVDALDSNVVADKVREVTKTLPASQLSKAITRISTEYRLQFAWPRRQQHQLTNGELAAAATREEAGLSENHQNQPVPRKSLSMGALRQGSIMAAPAPVHKKRQVASIDHRRDGPAQASELEPLVNVDGALLEADEHDELDATKSRAPKKIGGRAVRITEQHQPPQENGFRKSQERPFSATEVIELRRELKRLADEYKHRDWGSGMAGEDEAMLWKRVSNNHALNALSLARSATKEEKEKENTRKVAPAVATVAGTGTTTTTVAAAGRPSSVQARPIHGMLSDDFKPDNDRALARARKDFLVRHHLDRTTGTGDGALIPSPTREKLEPAMPRRREEQSDNQPRSKSSPKNSPRSARSQSVGPAVIERRSPKRHPQRPPSAAKDLKEKEKDKEMGNKSSERERHPRPSAVSRWKTREAGHKSRSRSASTTRPRTRRPLTATYASKPFLATNAPPHRPAHHHAKPVSSALAHANTNQTNVAGANAKAQTINAAQHNASQSTAAAATSAARHQPNARLISAPAAVTLLHSGKQLDRAHPSKSPTPASLRLNQAGQAMTAEPLVNGQHPHQPEVVPVPASQQPQQRGWIDDEPVVKSPPEPTRVKSPEQMIMRSPEPVNWTVPLDTGKTFTVTQNVREGELPTRAHSEARSWVGAGVMSAPQSAPPELAGANRQQHKLTEHKQLNQQQHQQQSGYKSPESESVSLGSFSGTNGHKDQEDSLGDQDSPLATIAKDEPSQEAHCLDDPVFEFDVKCKKELATAPGMPASVPSTATTAPQPTQERASDLLEKARNRFDKFWGSSKGTEQ